MTDPRMDKVEKVLERSSDLDSDDREYIRQYVQEAIRINPELTIQDAALKAAQALVNLASFESR